MTGVLPYGISHPSRRCPYAAAGLDAPVPLTPDEQAIVARIRRAKLFVFLRQERHTLFAADYQAELATLYKESDLGRPPVPPARLALTVILQAYTGASDDEAIECLTMDRRWQLVLDCLDAAEPPFSKATLVAFRQRLIAARADRRLIERTVDLARTTGLVGSHQLRGALDSSPLWCASRVEDTSNLLGHALTDMEGLSREVLESPDLFGATATTILLLLKYPLPELV